MTRELKRKAITSTGRVFYVDSEMFCIGLKDPKTGNKVHFDEFKKHLESKGVKVMLTDDYLEV